MRELSEWKPTGIILVGNLWVGAAAYLILTRPYNGR